MNNKYIKHLDSELDKFLKDEDNISALKRAGSLAEFKRTKLAVQYVIEKNLVLADDAKNADGIFVEFLDVSKRKYVDQQTALMAIQSMVLSSLASGKTYLEGMAVASGDKKEQKTAQKAIKEIRAVAGQVMPDYLVNTYSFIKSVNSKEGSAKIYNQRYELVFDFDEFFRTIQESARKNYPVSNLLSLDSDTEAKYRKVVSENIDGFLNILPDVVTKQKRAILEFERTPKPVSKVNSSIRAIRRENRPLNNECEELPSYLDYIKDDGNFVSFEEFKKSPSARVFNEFENEEDYVAYVTSSKFAQLVEYMEQPIKPEQITAKVPTFVVEQKGKVFQVQDSNDASDYGTNGFVIIGEYPKEQVILPKSEYKTVKGDEFITAEYSKIKNERALNAMKKVIAGATALVILANTLGAPVKEIVESVRGEEVVDPITPIEPVIPVDPVNPVNPINPVKPNPDTEYKNTEVKTDPSEIKDNPAHEITPDVDNMGDDGTIKPNLPEEETSGDETKEDESSGKTDASETPSEGTETPEEPEETFPDPSYDDPDGTPAEENHIGSDKKNESDDDEFFN